MKELTFGLILALFQEKFGPVWSWVILVAAVLFLAALITVVIRDGGVKASRFAWSRLIGLAGGSAAVAFIIWFTKSTIGDIGGPIDIKVLALVFLFGGGGAVMLGYVLTGLLGPSLRAPKSETRAEPLSAA